MPNLHETRRLAEQGDADAQFNLGQMYDDGQGVPQDAPRAALWYLRAAEQGHARAQHSLSVLYRLGRGVPKDDAEAVRWLHKMER